MHNVQTLDEYFYTSNSVEWHFLSHYGTFLEKIKKSALRSQHKGSCCNGNICQRYICFYNASICTKQINDTLRVFICISNRVMNIQ